MQPVIDSVTIDRRELGVAQQEVWLFDSRDA